MPTKHKSFLSNVKEEQERGKNLFFSEKNWAKIKTRYEAAVEWFLWIIFLHWLVTYRIPNYDFFLVEDYFDDILVWRHG